MSPMNRRYSRALNTIALLAFSAARMAMAAGSVQPETASVDNLEFAPNVASYETSHISVLNDKGALPTEADQPLRVHFSAYSREYLLDLVESDIIAKDAKTFVVDEKGPHEIPTKNYSYTGTLEGDPGAVVRVSIVGDSLKGVIYASDGEIGIEPLSNYSTKSSPGDVLVYRATDIAANWLENDTYTEEKSADTREKVSQATSFETSFPWGDGADIRVVHNRCILNGAIQGTTICASNTDCSGGATCMTQKKCVLNGVELGTSCVANADCSGGAICNVVLRSKQCVLNGAGLGTPCSANADCSGGAVCSLYQLKRLDLGLMADNDFTFLIHAGNVDAAIADMDSAVNAADPLFHGSLPRGKGSVPIALRVTRHVVFSSAAQQSAAGINSCPNTCQRPGTYQPGSPCRSIDDCNILLNENCFPLSTSSYICSGAYAGKYCMSNADCFPTDPCSPGTALLKVCDGGLRDGYICHSTTEGCTTLSDCCTNGAACVSQMERAARSAGRYRVANADWKANTGTIVRWSGCTLHGSVSVGGSCNGSGDGSSVALQDQTYCSAGPLADQHCDPNIDCTPGTCVKPTALSLYGVFGHEVGHSIGVDSKHDYGSACGALRMGHSICAGGTNKDLMCESQCTVSADCVRGSCSAGLCGDCPGSTCDKANIRYCSASNSSQACIANIDCAAGQTCEGPSMRVCIGGPRNGLPCRAENASTCPSDPISTGSCTGAPMTGGIYFESGSGTLAGFSPCSQTEINGYVNSTSNPPACLTTLVCADVDKSGALNTTDALAALKIATNLAPYDDQADVMPTDAPNGLVNTADSSFILQMVTGQYPPPTVCGRVNAWTW